MLFNKDLRLRYLGFNDSWFAGISILILSLATTYLFNNFAPQVSFFEISIHWFISLIFTVCNWLFMRSVMIHFRIKFPHLRETTKRIVIVFLFILLSVPFIDFIGSSIIEFIFNGRPYNVLSRMRVILPIIIISVMIQAIYEAIFYHTRLKEIIRNEEQAAKALVQTQLDVLRNQAQPHFFFNSLNTLRDIIDQNSKDDAKKFVDKLSNIYRFILESGNSNLIALRDELKFAKAYIHIQKERFGENLKVEWIIPDIYLDKMIVPMSIQILLENAIKHNVVSRAKNLTVAVSILNHNIIVKNKIQEKSTQLSSTKLGLKNIEKRYSLISEDPVEIKNDGQEFKVTLPLLSLTDQNH